MKYQFEISQFTYSNTDEKKTFSQEASTLGLKPGIWPQEFTITNPKTGNKVKFRMAYDKQDSSGEFMGYVYFGTYDFETSMQAIIWND